MKKNPRDYKVNGKQYAYILDCINPEMIDVDSDGMSDKEKMELTLKEFDRCSNYWDNKKNYPNIVDRFEQWMRGLPGVFDVEFVNYNIAQIGKEWGYSQTKKKEAAFVENWWHAIACKFFQLARLLGVDYEKYM